MKMLTRILLIFAVAACFLYSTALTACPYSIRDSAFIGRGSKAVSYTHLRAHET